VTLLDDVLPQWHFRERHSKRVSSSPERVFSAVRAITLAELPVARVLVWLRGMGAAADPPLLQEMRRAGFEIVSEERHREIVWAAVGQPWKLRGGRRAHDPNFRSFDEPGYAKMAFNFRLDDDTLSTETRVFLTDDRSRRRFRLYWLAIRPFSGLIRRLWLRAIARAA
jgi:hypothetical protein